MEALYQTELMPHTKTSEMSICRQASRACRIRGSDVIRTHGHLGANEALFQTELQTQTVGENEKPDCFCCNRVPIKHQPFKEIIGATLAHTSNPYMRTGGRPWVPTDYCVRRVECYVSRIAF